MKAYTSAGRPVDSTEETLNSSLTVSWVTHEETTDDWTSFATVEPERRTPSQERAS